MLIFWTYKALNQHIDCSPWRKTGGEKTRGASNEQLVWRRQGEGLAVDLRVYKYGRQPSPVECHVTSTFEENLALWGRRVTSIILLWQHLSCLSNITLKWLKLCRWVWNTYCNQTNFYWIWWKFKNTHITLQQRVSYHCKENIFPYFHSVPFKIVNHSTAHLTLRSHQPFFLHVFRFTYPWLLFAIFNV